MQDINPQACFFPSAFLISLVLEYNPTGTSQNTLVRWFSGHHSFCEKWSGVTAQMKLLDHWHGHPSSHFSSYAQFLRGSTKVFPKKILVRHFQILRQKTGGHPNVSFFCNAIFLIWLILIDATFFCPSVCALILMPILPKSYPIMCRVIEIHRCSLPTQP